MQGSVTLENEGKVIAQLQAVDRKTQRRTIRKATTAAGKVTLATTKQNARSFRQTGFTSRSLKSVTRSRTGITTVKIGQAKQKTFKARKSSRVGGRNLSQIQRAGKPVPIHWIEFGTKTHFIQAAPGKRLVFRVGRRTKNKTGLAFARKVLIPGMRPRHLLRKSGRQSRRAASGAFVSVAARELNSA